MNESRATRYQRTRRRTRGAAVACGIAVLAVAALTPVGQAMAAWAGREVAALPAPLRELGALLLFITILVAAFALALVSAAFAIRRQAGSAAGRQAEDHGSRTSQLLAAAMILPVAIWCAIAVQAGVAIAGSRWWIVTAGILIATLAAAMQAAPALLARVGGSRPLSRPSLIERLGALARRLRVDIQSIEEVPSSASVTSTALVAGTGGSRRVFIAADLLRDWSDDEIA